MTSPKHVVMTSPKHIVMTSPKHIVMTSPKHIVAGTDFSTASEVAVGFAASLARAPVLCSSPVPVIAAPSSASAKRKGLLPRG